MNQQNTESPFGNPRFLMALAVTFFVLWGWQFYMNKKYPQTPATQTQTTEMKNTAPDSISNQGASVSASQTNSQSTLGQTEINSDVATNIPQDVLKFTHQDVSFEVRSQGMSVHDFTLKKYTDRKKNPIIFKNVNGQAQTMVNNQVVHFKLTQVSDNEFKGVALVNNQEVTKTLIFHPEKFYFESKVQFTEVKNLQTLIYQDHHQPENTNFFMPSFEQQDFIFIDGEKTKDENISHIKQNEGFLKTSPAVKMASIGTQYFVLSSINKSEVIPSVSNKVENNVASVTLNYSLDQLKVSEIKEIIYLGPKQTEILKSVDPLLPEVMNYGMFGFISKPLLQLMIFLNKILGNWGLAIIGLTLIMRALMLPFNIISFRSAQAMQRIKPQMDAIREKYKNDPMRMNKETMDLMKTANANPLMGCLPMLIQLPIFFALWKTIGSSIEIYQQPFFGWIHDLSFHDPLFIFPVLMGVTMYLQQKLTPTTMDPMQAKILNFMPILFTLFMLTLPSGLTLYNFVSALFGVVQQYFLLKDNNTTKDLKAVKA